MGSELNLKIKKALESIESIRGVDGTLVVDNQGEILYSNLLSDDVMLFGSMANIISNSSEKLLDLSKQGEIERVLVESSNGKALFLNLEKAHLVVLLGKKANLGMAILSSKKAAHSIKEMKEIQELPVYVEEVPEIEVSEEITEEPITSSEASVLESNEAEKVMVELKSTIEEIKEEETLVQSELNEAQQESSIETSFEEPTKTPEEITKESSPTLEEVEIEEPSSATDEITKETPETLEEGADAASKSPTLEVEEELAAEDSVVTEVEEIKPPETGIPVIKPPLSFPTLPESVVIPEDLQEKSELITDIYEAILVAMSIGASKIMGVSPARGMLKKSLPYDKCPEILNEVDVKNNSSLQFEAIRKNLEQIPIENRTDKLIKDFTTIISAITDNYGRVMGYDAFRGMIRPEFKKIYDSFGPAMENLGIKEKIHPELRQLLVS